MKKVKCASGLTGWQGKLRRQYADFGEFEHYDGIYGLARRLGYPDARAAWDADPTVQGSVEPSDFRVVPPTGQPKARKVTPGMTDKDFWCECGNPSTQVDYHHDGASKVCHKHHWTCRDCGKVLQVG